MKSRQCLLQISTITGMLLSGIFWSSPAFAVDNLDLFELEGDAADFSSAAPFGPAEDWQSINSDGGNSLRATGVLVDPAPLSVFTGGGSKDEELIAKWSYKNGSVPPKDDILNAYATAFQHNNDLIIYFGADRYSTSGDAQIGFWFFQNQVDTNPGGSGFTGEHIEGDILVLANFLNGGAEVSVEVFEWVDSGGDASEHLLNLGHFGKCDGSGNDACAITNMQQEPSFWPFAGKGAPANVFPVNAFFEGGINVTQLIGNTPCFASFLAETRSSQSTDAVLKDFVIDSFPLCAISASKTCEVTALTTEADASDNPDDRIFKADATVTVTNAGAASLPAGTEITIEDNPLGNSTPPAEIVIVLAEPLAPGDSIDVDLTFFTDDNPPMNTADVSATFGEQTLTASVDPAVICNSLQFNPALYMNKMCETMLSDQGNLIAVEVEFDLLVCNTGDVPLSVDVDDPIAGISFSLDLDAGVPCLVDSDCDTSLGSGDGICIGADENPGVCSNLPGIISGDPVCDLSSSSFLPSSVSDLSPESALFSNTATASATSPVLQEPIEAMATANCLLCPSL